MPCRSSALLNALESGHFAELHCDPLKMSSGIISISVGRVNLFQFAHLVVLSRMVRFICGVAR